jgi:hypothetical protein
MVAPMPRRLASDEAPSACWTEMDTVFDGKLFSDFLRNWLLRAAAASDTDESNSR